MLIVDAQVHIWGRGLPTNPSHRQISSFSQDDLLKEMDAAGVNAAVIHPPGWDPNSNELAVEAARQHPNRLAILGNFPLDRPESRALVDGWKQRPGMLGCRFTFNQPHQRTWMTDGTIDWLWPVAERHPGLRLIIDHFGRTGGTKDAAAFANLSGLLALGKYPNVAVKATGAPSYSSESYPYHNIQPYLRQIYEVFGPERMFWGTDITRMPCSWKQCITFFTEELSWLSEHDKELIMGRALCHWLNWQLPG